MGRRKRVSSETNDNYNDRRFETPATTAEGRENQLIALAYDLAERRLRDGSATSAEVVHFLKAGTAREKFERAKLEQEIAKTKAQTEALQSAKHVEELYSEAMVAFRSYSGMPDVVETFDD